MLPQNDHAEPWLTAEERDQLLRKLADARVLDFATRNTLLQEVDVLWVAAHTSNVKVLQQFQDDLDAIATERSPQATELPVLAWLRAGTRLLRLQGKAEATIFEGLLRVVEVRVAEAGSEEEPKPPLHVTCDRVEHLRVIGERRSGARRVLITGPAGAGHAFLLRRFCWWPEELQVGRVLPVVFPDQSAPVNGEGCWEALREALQARVDPSYPRGPALQGIAKLAESAPVALVHGTVRVANGGLDVLARFHEQLRDELLTRRHPDGRPLAEHVLVVQSIEESGDDRLGDDHPLLAPTLFGAGDAVRLPPLGDLPPTEVARFADLLVQGRRLDPSAAPAFVDLVKRASPANRRYRVIAAELGEDASGELS